MSRKIVSLGLNYVTLPEQSLELIHNLFCHDMVGEPETALEQFYFGSYYFFVVVDRTKAVTYWEKSAERNCCFALSQLGHYYQSRGEYDRAISCYQQAIAAGNYYAPGLLGVLYYRLGKKTLMEETFLQAIAIGNANCLQNLITYYCDQIPAKNIFDFAITHQVKKLVKKTPVSTKSGGQSCFVRVPPTGERTVSPGVIYGSAL